MRGLLKGAILAASIAGAAATGAMVASSTPAEAQARVGVTIGTPGFSITYRDGYYRDRWGRRHHYRYPSDYRRWGRPRSWYYQHRYWDRYDHRDWYRR